MPMEVQVQVGGSESSSAPTSKVESHAITNSRVANKSSTKPSLIVFRRIVIQDWKETPCDMNVGAGDCLPCLQGAGR
eukprot:5442366-Amphidinium_carterae.1